MSDRVAKSSHLMWVPVAKMRVHPTRQRRANRNWLQKTLPDFDPEKLGYPVCNHDTAGDVFWIIDGQHRVELVRQALGDDQQVQCEVFKDLTPDEEALVFLSRNHRTAVQLVDRFRISIEAGDVESATIAAILRHHGLKIDYQRDDDSISAVKAVQTIYRLDEALLARTVLALKDAYTAHRIVWDAPIMEGVAMTFHRYNGRLGDDEVRTALATIPGGVTGLVQRSKAYRHEVGGPIREAVASTIVDSVNRKRRGKAKLEPWRRARPDDEDET